MAILSRSGRAAKTAGEPMSTHQPDEGHRQAVSGASIPPSPHLQPGIDFDDGFANNVPAAKRRKLSIRHKQTTLDGFTIPLQGPLKPPTKVTVSQPHGQLLETINGVRIALDANEDELGTSMRANGTPAGLSQPAPPPIRAESDKKEDKRTLRSHDDGPRLKSELAIYFPNYEDIIFDVQGEQEFVTVDTSIYVTDTTPRPEKPEQPSSGKKSKTARPVSSHTTSGSVNGSAAPFTPQRSLPNQVNNSPRESLEMIARTLPDQTEDPLTDAHFFKSHRRAERKEKQLRNIERERAMHEKVQLERILDGLQGHDWLKVLGITGITDSEAKKYEMKRNFFIEEVRTLVDKFKQWKEQERSQRLRKDQIVAVNRDAESEERDTERGSVGPPSSDLNASASRQLQQETVNAVKATPKLKLSFSQGKQAVMGATQQNIPANLGPASPEVPITSFYDKRHLRDAALGKARHGRNVTAFGYPLPDLVDREFVLPDELLTEDAVRANARERRRRKRECVANAAST